MIKIYKYPIEITHVQTIEMPAWPQILHVGLDPKGIPCVWAKVDIGKDVEEFEIHIYGTGHPVSEESCNYLGSFNLRSFIWHVFSPFRH